MRLNFDLKIQPALLSQVAKLERLMGQLETKLERNFHSKPYAEITNSINSLCALRSVKRADQTQIRIEEILVKKIIDNGVMPGKRDLLSLASLLAGIDTPGVGIKVRSEAASFYGQLAPIIVPEQIFPTLAPYMVERRVDEILEWVRVELEKWPAQDAEWPPVIVISAAFVMLLQAYPVGDLTHPCALLLMLCLFNQHNFSLATESNLIGYFETYRSHYFQLLREAEKSLFANWATLSPWIGFVIDALTAGAQKLLSESNYKELRPRLTTTQEEILNCIRKNSPASREIIAEATGINLATVKYNLGILVEQRYLNRVGNGRATSYRPV
ncbi:winged helix-turn-helix domain-containing protein [bacterium]|nr:winged helix-turn-helix domain-containing protein [bacterium]